MLRLETCKLSGVFVSLSLSLPPPIPEQIHCVDPFTGETLHVATELPIMLTSLAVVPRLPRERLRRPPRAATNCAITTGGPGGDGRGGGGEPRSDALDMPCNHQEVVAAVGGVGGGVRLVAMQVRAGGEGGGHSLVAYLCHLTIDHADPFEKENRSYS